MGWLLSAETNPGGSKMSSAAAVGLPELLFLQSLRPYAVGRENFHWAGSGSMLLSAGSLQPTLMVLFIKVTATQASFYHVNEPNFPVFFHPQATPFQVWGILGSSKHPFCRLFIAGNDRIYTNFATAPS